MAESSLSTFFILSTWTAVALQFLRLSIDLVQAASATPSSSSSSSTVAASPDKSPGTNDPKKEGSKEASTAATALKAENATYGSVAKTDEESQPLLVTANGHAEGSSPSSLLFASQDQIILACQVSMAVLFFLGATLGRGGASSARAFTFWAALWTTVEAIVSHRDASRERYGIFQRILRWLTAVFLGLSATSASLPTFTMFLVVLVLVLAVYDDNYSVKQRRPATTSTPTEASSSPTAGESGGKLSRQAMLILLKPYVWPDATTNTAFWNRVRAIATWVCVILSKVCNLTSPLMLGNASTALAHQDYVSAIRYSIAYAAISWTGSLMKECQSLVYLRVAQAAFVQLSETVFEHLHQLSLDWHLGKKLGEVLRSMDRGIAACDTLMKYLFLWLVPALVECLVVTIIFATYFKYLPLALAVFSFVFAYIVWTILMTLWRKKFRKALVKSDNAWHDRFTDSMVNFETVKYFTAEAYEKKRFGSAVSHYQKGSVNVQASLSLLNISQQILLQSCMATALSLAAYGIRQRLQCCVETVGCDSALSDCCQAVDLDVCPGMQMGDFVSVLSYVMNLFAPLNFLGSVYNAVVMAVIDLTNLSELLAESPDVTDAPDALQLPRNLPAPSADEDDIAVEFDNVVFHYPTQSDTSGLKGLSFKMRRGTTTAIVGPTGAGKTTVSRLFFRFYDVLGGAVKVNGVDVRSMTQKSLRQAIGVVPQDTIMFNDTLRSNVLYGRQGATEEELVQAAEDAQLTGFIDSLDDGWETMVGDRGLKLSGGEKQRASIARCLLKDPPFVILDEATSALDTLTEKSVQEALDRLGAERTVLVIAHRLGTIRNADNIVVLKEGVVAEQGTHDELLERNALYAEMWNMQLHSTSARASQVSFGDLTDSSEYSHHD